MKLCALELDQFRKFDRPVRVEGFGPGLNLLVGPNETGKSTLLCALRTVLFERHRAGGEHIRSLLPHGHRTAPFVALEFELEGRRHRIEKRFLRGEHARLHLPDGRRLEGDAAEEELQRLLGFAGPGPRGITSEQQGIWSLLLVPQGGAFAQPEIADGARRSLEEALGDEVDALLGSDEAAAVVRAVELARRELVDGHGRPRGRYKAAIERDRELEAEIRRLEETRRAVAGAAEALEARRRRLATLQDEREEALLLRQRDEARSRRDQLRALHEQLRAAEARCALAEHEQARLAREIGQRAELEREIGELRERCAAAAPAEAAARDALAAAERGVAERERRRREQEEARERAAVDLAGLRRLQAHLAAVDGLGRLEGALGEAEAADAEADRLRRAAEAIRLDESALEELRRAARDVERAEAGLQAVATSLHFEIDDAALAAVRVDGAPLADAAAERLAVAPTRVEIAGVGAITIIPQIADRERLVEQHEHARRRLQRLLSEAGVPDLERAEGLLRERRRLLGEAELARRRGRIITGAVLPGVESAQGLRAEIELRRQRLQGEEAGPGMGGPLDPGATAGRIAAVETMLAGLEQDLREARALAEAAREERERRQRAHDAASTTLRRAEADLEALERQRSAAEERRSRDLLEVDLAAAAAALAAARHGLDALQEQGAGASLELVEREIARLERAIEQRRAEAGELRVDIGRLQAQIEQHEAAGLDEQIEETARRRALCQREQAACERDRQALALLLTTLEEARREAKERYLRPVALRLRPYLQGLFPGAQVVVDESLRITTLGRGGRAEPFAQLSDGTREQVAVLVRLAFAELLAERGCPAVVVLDDALAFSDDARLEQMFTLLHHAARRLQIVVLTCRERVFESLGASRLRIVEAAGAAAAAD